MSNLGLDADLSLDIRSALDQASRLEAAITRALSGGQVLFEAEVDTSAIAPAITSSVAAADSQVIVTGEADSLTGDVTSAIDAADSTVPVDADTTGVASEVTAALDAADSSVAVDADTAGVAGEVSAALDAADTSVAIDGEATGVTAAVNAAVDAADTSITIDADSGSLEQAANSADLLDSALIASTQSGLNLRAALQLGGAGAAAGGLYLLVDAASELEQSIGGTTAIFGDYSTEVSGFAQTASEAAGLTEQSARQLTSQIGGLLQGFGFTQDEAAETSVVLAQLGADLAATFGGTSQEAVEALGAAIRGETDPIERFGISLNATAADARAVELGLAASTTQVSANARAQGALSLIMERSAQAQGQFGREVNTTAGQLERARAEMGNAAAEVGENLQPAVNQIVASFRSDLLPALIDLGNNAGPALADLFIALAPAFGSTTDLILALTPAIGALASVIEVVPGPVLAGVAAFAAFQRVLGPIPDAVRNIGNPITAMRSSLTAGNFALAAGAAAFSFWASEQAAARQETADFAADVDGFADALSGSANAAAGYTAQLETLVKANEELTVSFGFLSEAARFEVDVADTLNRAGVSAEQFGDAVAAGGDTLDEFIAGIGDTSEEGDALRFALDRMAESMNEGARESIEAGVALGEWTDRAADAAIEAATASDGTINYATALDVLKDAQREEAASAREAAEAQDALASAVGGTDSEGATRGITLLGESIDHMRDGIGNGAEDFGRFALAMDAADLSAEELDAVAASLGTTADKLGPAVERAVARIYDLRDSTASTLPSLQEIAGEIDEFTVESFTDNLEEAYDAIVNFQDNLALLQEASPRVAAAAAQLGPEYAAALAEGLREGRPGVLDEAELYLAGIEAEGAKLDSYITNDLGPELALATGDLGRGMAEAFGGQLQLEPGVRESIRAIEGTVESEGPGFADRLAAFAAAGETGFAAEFGLDAAPGIFALGQQITSATTPFGERLRLLAAAGDAGFGGEFGPDPGPALQSLGERVAANLPTWAARMRIMAQTGNTGFGGEFGPNPNPGITAADRAVRGRQGGFFSTLQGLGSSGRSGFGAGIGGMDGAAARATNSAIAAVKNAGGGAYSGGYTVGQQVAQGFNSGLSSLAGSIAATGASMVSSALSAMRSRAGISSPARVFIEEVGKPIAEGVEVGIAQGTSAAALAGVGLVDTVVADAASAVAGLSVPTALTPDFTTFAGSTPLSGGGGTVINVHQGAVQIILGPGETPEDAGARAWRGFEAAAARHDVGVTAGMR